MSDDGKSAKRVVLYTQPRCGNCGKAKEFLSSRKIAYEEKDVAHDREALLELVEIHKSQITPTIVVGDQVFIGYNRKKLAAALGLS
jgi:glutaredoxin 3